MIGLKPGNIKTVMGVELVPDTTIDQVETLDILLIPGGFKETRKHAYNPTLLDWITKIDQTTTDTTAVCAGGWIQASAGLLKNRNATTNWFIAEEMMRKFGARFSGERYTQDGKYWTSAGVTTGMGMALAMVSELRGEKYAQAIMLDMEYDAAPPMQDGSPDSTPTGRFQNDALHVRNCVTGDD